MNITEKHIKALKDSLAISEGRGNIINRPDAEECVDMGLLGPTRGYPLTERGREILKSCRN